jgi:uncharacterized protein YqjF (DUF2071 family)
MGPAVRLKVLEEPGTEFGSQPSDPVPHPLLIHEWSELAFVHWRYPADEVQALLPEGLEVDTFDGSAWVGLVPFHCTIRPRGIPRIPWVSSFPEMNVRTYVRGPHGESAVWFISLEAARLGAVLIARSTYGLRYHWAKMAYSRVGDVAVYETRRRWPGRRSAAGSLAVEIGDPLPPKDTDELERWLINRWRFYCVTPGGLATGLVAHETWPLRAARLLHCDARLVSACGLAPPSGDPVTHYGGRVEVRMTRPYLCR